MIQIQGNYDRWDYSWGKYVPSAPGRKHMRSEVEVLTCAHYRANENLNSDTELYGDNCIQDAGDPFVLLRYRVSSVTIRINERTQNDEGHPTFELGRFGQRW